jgi:DNA-directed RNA polymerase specialized sigma24 family protein
VASSSSKTSKDEEGKEGEEVTPAPYYNYVSLLSASQSLKVAAQTMNNLLRPLLNAWDEQERQQRLDELLTIHVRPIVRQVLRQRLGFYVSAQGVNETNRDAEDLYQEALTRIVEVLQADQRVLTKIEDFEPYVGRVVSNVCADFLHSKHPTRARLENALRDVFRQHADLLSWQFQSEIVCGFAAWRNAGKQTIDVYDVEAKLNGFVVARFADEDLRVVPLSRIVTELFQWLGGPVQIDVLVRMVAYVRDLKEQQLCTDFNLCNL